MARASRWLPRATRGSAVLELSFLAPWIFFLFVGAFDMGFYSYSLIAVENAARVAAEYTSQNSTTAGDSSGACGKVLPELAMLPNVPSNLTTCNASPVVVTATYLAAGGPDLKSVTSVKVKYTGLSLVPIPGLLMGRLSFERDVTMRVKP